MVPKLPAVGCPQLPLSFFAVPLHKKALLLLLPH
jgi:hypothetical protein